MKIKHLFDDIVNDTVNDTVFSLMKKKKPIQSLVNYFRELSIVVIGVAITAGLGFWINNNNLKKDQNQYLGAIQLELEENARQFDYIAQWLQKSLRYTQYINSAGNNSLNKDTLQYYGRTDNDGCGFMYTGSMSAMITTNAFEMFKSSGTMRQVKNKQQLQSIWKVYAQIEMAQLNIDKYFQIKEEEVMRFLRSNEEGKEIEVPMKVFYTSGMPHEMVRWSTQTSQVIKEALSNFSAHQVAEH